MSQYDRDPDLGEERMVGQFGLWLERTRVVGESYNYRVEISRPDKPVTTITTARDRAEAGAAYWAAYATLAAIAAD